MSPQIYLGKLSNCWYKAVSWLFQPLFSLSVMASRSLMISRSHPDLSGPLIYCCIVDISFPVRLYCYHFHFWYTLHVAV